MVGLIHPILKKQTSLVVNYPSSWFTQKTCIYTAHTHTQRDIYIYTYTSRTISNNPVLCWFPIFWLSNPSNHPVGRLNYVRSPFLMLSAYLFIAYYQKKLLVGGFNPSREILYSHLNQSSPVCPSTFEKHWKTITKNNNSIYLKPPDSKSPRFRHFSKARSPRLLATSFP